MKLKSIPLMLMLPVLMAAMVGCGAGNQTADTPTTEAKDAAEVKVEPSPTKQPPKPEPIKSSTPTLTPTAIVDKIVAEPTPTNQPTPKSSPVKKSSPLDLDPKISCVLNKEENQITCVATNIREGSQLKWTSTASDAHSGGSKWQFTIYKQPVGDVEQVFLDICQGSTCQTFETSIDTSELVSESTRKDTSPEPTTPSTDPAPMLT